MQFLVDHIFLYTKIWLAMHMKQKDTHNVEVEEASLSKNRENTKRRLLRSLGSVRYEFHQNIHRSVAEKNLIKKISIKANKFHLTN